MTRLTSRIERKGRWIGRAVKAVFILSALFLIIEVAAVGFGAYKAAQMAKDADWSDGLRGVMETVWCGRKNCMLGANK
jgi:hypothetical protein